MSKIWYAPHQFQAYGDREIQAVVKSLNAGWLAPGRRVAEFEDCVAALYGRRYGVMTNSGSSANLLAITALNLSKGSAVITPACTFATTLAPILQTGAIPRFVDVAPGRLVPSVEQVLERVDRDVRAIFIPDLVGDRFDWVGLRRRLAFDCLCIQDSCDTIGAHATESDLVTTSFYASHAITTGGAGGMVMTDSAGVRQRLLSLRDWGRAGDDREDYTQRFATTLGDVPFDSKFLYTEMGYNFRPTEMQAAFGLAQLERLENRLQVRRALVDQYRQELADTEYVFVKDDPPRHWLAMPLRHSHRAQVVKHLEEHEVQARMLMAGNITRHPAYQHYHMPLPNSDMIMHEGFLVGAHHGMTDQEVTRVCRLLKEVAE